MMASTWEAPDRIYAVDPKKRRIELLPLRSPVWSGRQSHELKYNNKLYDRRIIKILYR